MGRSFGPSSDAKIKNKEVLEYKVAQHSNIEQSSGNCLPYRDLHLYQRKERYDNSKSFFPNTLHIRLHFLFYSKLRHKDQAKAARAPLQDFQSRFHPMQLSKSQPPSSLPPLRL
mmetsp:Transcript_24291/g.50263  ORF Transcript_24291/g.50263 Transcript_24291/m.50263 type:complete len:114 (-) Transcript_24291:471-812(-)